jgi:tetratricopeptide (TPR) repeat protein
MRFNEAAAGIDLALTVTQTDPDVWNLKGRICEARGMVDDALTAYSRAIELLGTPTNVSPEISLSVHLRRAEMCKRLGRSAEAQGDLQIAEQMQERLQARQDTDQRMRSGLVCHGHLRSIELAKVMWADENNKELGSQVTESDLKPFIGNDGKMPTCPSGGTYKLNKTGEQPTCSIPGHGLDSL